MYKEKKFADTDIKKFRIFFCIKNENLLKNLKNVIGMCEPPDHN